MKTVSVLHDKSPMYTYIFDFTSPEGLKITPSDETKIEKSKEKRVKKKKPKFLLIFISSTD